MTTLRKSLLFIFLLLAMRVYAKDIDFASYAVPKVSVAKVARLDFSADPRARRFRKKISKAIGMQANYAGHYVIISWGCGSYCSAIAIIDVESGLVRLAPFSTSLGYSIKANSRLFVDSPQEEKSEMNGNVKNGGKRIFFTRYFEWIEKEKVFKLLAESVN